MTALEKAEELLNMACTSVENQANWDKPPYSLWYYNAKRFLRRKELMFHEQAD